jgi:hypothetical protein
MKAPNQNIRLSIRSPIKSIFPWERQCRWTFVIVIVIRNRNRNCTRILGPRNSPIPSAKPTTNFSKTIGISPPQSHTSQPPSPAPFNDVDFKIPTEKSRRDGRNHCLPGTSAVPKGTCSCPPLSRQHWVGVGREGVLAVLSSEGVWCPWLAAVPCRVVVNWSLLGAGFCYL